MFNPSTYSLLTVFWLHGASSPPACCGIITSLWSGHLCLCLAQADLQGQNFRDCPCNQFQSCPVLLMRKTFLTFKSAASAMCYIVWHCWEGFGSIVFVTILLMSVLAVRLPLAHLFATLNKSNSLSFSLPGHMLFIPDNLRLWWMLQFFHIPLELEVQHWRVFLVQRHQC